MLTRVAAFGIACVMLVGLTVHKQHGFLGIAIASIIGGAGLWSRDPVPVLP